MFERLKKIFSSKNNNGLDRLFLDLKLSFKDFSTVMDVGAYHGGFADAILKINPHLQVHLFEPFTESFDLIKRRFQNNQSIIINHAAVSDISGTATLNINSFKETNSLLESGDICESINALTESQSRETVPVIQLDEYCSERGIEKLDFVKIDTQGNSYNVLKGMQNLLRNTNVGYLYVEAEFVEIYKNEKLFSEIELLMREYNYSIVDLYNFNYINNEKLGWCDVLYSPKKL